MIFERETLRFAFAVALAYMVLPGVAQAQQIELKVLDPGRFSEPLKKTLREAHGAAGAPAILQNPYSLADLFESTENLAGYVADGVTTVLVAVKAPEAGCVDFFVQDEDLAAVSGAIESVGVLRDSLNPQRGGQSSLLVDTVHVEWQKPSGQWIRGDYAFVSLTAPLDFVRSNQDKLSRRRPVRIEADFRKKIHCFGTSQPDSTRYWHGSIARPPLVLLHGVTSSPANFRWNELDDSYVSVPGAGSGSLGWIFDETSLVFDVLLRASYDLPTSVKRYSSWLPGIPFSDVEYEKKNCQSFFENRDVAYKLCVQPALAKMRKKGFAVTQVDAVGHSMGGVLLRIFAEDGHHYDEGLSNGESLAYRRNDNWMKGDFHKLVTIASPHFGSPYWDDINKLINHPLLYLLPDTALLMFGIKGALASQGLYDGGLKDMSKAFPETLREAIVPSFAIVGTSSQAIFNSNPLVKAWGKMKRDSGDKVGYVSYLPQAAIDFVFSSFKTIPNDTAVEVASAMGGLDPGNCALMPTPLWEVIHSSMGYHPEADPVSGSAIGYVGQGSSPVIATKVLELLNERLGGSSTLFASKFPAHSGFQGLMGGGSSAMPNLEELDSQVRPLTVRVLDIVSPSSGATIAAGSTPSVSFMSLRGFQCNSFAVGDGHGFEFSSPGNGSCSGIPQSCSIPFPIPLSAIGTRRFFAIAEGNLLNGAQALAYSSPVEVTIVPPPGVSLLGIRTEQVSVDLFQSSPRVLVKIVGQFSDIERDISGLPGLVFTMLNSTIATIDSSGMVRGKALGATALLVQYLGHQVSVPVNVFSIQGDWDGDGVVDAADFGKFAACFSNEGTQAGNQCLAVFDFDEDRDIDMNDFESFKLVWSPSGIPDCNGNGQDDRLEILTGQMTDCDANGIPDACAAQDCDADGTPDICEVTPQDFGFADPASHASSYGSPVAVAVGDFDGNGIADIATASGSGVSLLLGQPVGSFHYPYYSSTGNGLPVGNTIVALAAANLDGNPANDELVAVCATSSGFGSVAIFRNGSSSNGVFAQVQIAALTTAASGSSPKALSIGDFNADGFFDLAVVKSGASNFGEVDILWNKYPAPGVFKAPQNVTDDFHAQAGASGIVCGDFNRDGRIDLATCNETANSVSILQNAGGAGTGAFLNPNAARTFDVADNVLFDSPAAIAAGDMTGDGWSEIAIVERASGAVHILVNEGENDPSGAPQFQPVYAIARVGSQASFLAAADFNGDGRKDLAVGGSASPFVSVLAMNPMGCRFWGNGAATRLDLADFANIRSLAIGQVDGEGGTDLITVNGRYLEHPNDPDASRNISVYRNLTILPSKQDRDGNGRPDSCDDANGNQVLDSCDIKNGLLEDCNRNLVADYLEIAAHPELDCNANGQVDSCDIAGSSIHVTSPQIGPVYYQQNHAIVLSGPMGSALPPAPSGATVAVKLTASAPFDHALGQPAHINDDRLLVVFRKVNPPSSSPSISVYAFAGAAYHGCAAQDSWTVNLTPEQFNEWLAYSSEGKPVVEIYPQSGMNADCSCAASWVKVDLAYGQPGSVDLNQNGIPDECEGG